MAFPQPVLDNIAIGKEYLSDRNAEVIADQIDGCSNCNCSKDDVMLKRLLYALDKLSIIGDYDDISQGLYLQMMLIIGGFIPSNDFFFFRVDDHVFVQTNSFYDGVFTQEGGHLFITQDDRFDDDVLWDVTEDYHLTVNVL